jgi:anthranilate phosphoribosyltransferase
MNNTLALIEKIEATEGLTRGEAETIMEDLLSGRLETSGIVRMLLALNQRPLTVGELSGFATIMRRHAAPVFPPGEDRPAIMVDTCGTGGDSSGTFNISTAAALVAAAAGAVVAKHGNRSVSSRSGSADVLEALGVRIEAPLERAGRAIREVGIGFLYAPAAHTATRHAVPARKQIGKKTVFNLLGPLTNPAGAETQVLGVFSAEVLQLVAATLAELGVKRAFVLHGAGGLDEISLAGETQVTDVRDGSIRAYQVTPEDFGVRRAPIEALQGGPPQKNAAMILEILQGQKGPRHDVVVMNASAALVATGIAEGFRAGASLAARAISSGAALEKMERLKKFMSEGNSKAEDGNRQP